MRLPRVGLALELRDGTYPIGWALEDKRCPVPTGSHNDRHDPPCHVIADRLIASHDHRVHPRASLSHDVLIRRHIAKLRLPMDAGSGAPDAVVLKLTRQLV